MRSSQCCSNDVIVYMYNTRINEDKKYSSLYIIVGAGV